MDITNRLIALRKKNKYSQEELADLLHVSRQTITKWENGSVPTLDLFISLSQLYGISLDDFVKEPCASMEETTIVKDQLISFLLEAKRNTYAAKKNKTESSRLHSLDYAYEKDDYRYLDSFVGSSDFSGQEIVWYLDQPVWSMNYYGTVLHPKFSSDFLKEALLSGTTTIPYRGNYSYQKGEYLYVMQLEGEFSYFQGKEVIYYQEIKVYECFFHGGNLK